MNWLSMASAAVKPALEERRIGTPVAVRLVVNNADRPPQLWATLGRGFEAASAWLGSAPDEIAACGGPEAGQISALARFPQGQTALVCVGPRGRAGPLADLAIVGNRGTLSWLSGPETFGLSDEDSQTLSPAAERLVEQARHSLATVESVAEPNPAASAAVPQVRTQPPYGILLIAGAHTHQENYAPLFAADPRCRLIAVTDEPDVPKRRHQLNGRLASMLDIPHFSDLNEALSRQDVHAVSICAEPERRARVAIRCAEAGKHLYLDKPMAASAQEAEAVAAAARRAGVVSQMFSSVRYPVGGRLRRLLASGTLGEPRAIHFFLTFAKGPAGAARLGRPRKESAQPRRFETIDSKRELFNVGIYPLVLLEWLFRRPIQRVWAATGNYFFAEHQTSDMEDFGMMLLQLAGGLTATITVGRTGWRSHPMAGINRTTIVGSQEVATIDMSYPRWDAWVDQSPWLPPRLHPDDPMGFWRSTMDEAGTLPKQAWLATAEEPQNDASHFLDCIQQGQPSDVSAERAASAVRSLMTGYRSAATGEGAAP